MRNADTCRDASPRGRRVVAGRPGHDACAESLSAIKIMLVRISAKRSESTLSQLWSPGTVKTSGVSEEPPAHHGRPLIVLEGPSRLMGLTA
jgi:hypothetical protein